MSECVAKKKNAARGTPPPPPLKKAPSPTGSIYRREGGRKQEVRSCGWKKWRIVAAVVPEEEGKERSGEIRRGWRAKERNIGKRERADFPTHHSVYTG